jgi:hypothetical protein
VTLDNTILFSAWVTLQTRNLVRVQAERTEPVRLLIRRHDEAVLRIDVEHYNERRSRPRLVAA